MLLFYRIFGIYIKFLNYFWNYWHRKENPSTMNVLTHFSPLLHFIQKPVTYFVVQIKWLVSTWNATMDWNKLILCYVSDIHGLSQYGNTCSVTLLSKCHQIFPNFLFHAGLSSIPINEQICSRLSIKGQI